ncbi:MAG: sulfurtransferase-like selenium metabolism protein YedF [Clostridiales bacterium]|nr:sulfurtransferase-like selenium metabolism protein YedF [Clostridiales bacterium]
MIQVNAIGDTCPIPVIKTKKAIEGLGGSGVVKTLVDNEIAVQNLAKMAKQKGYGVQSEKLSEGKYEVTMLVGVADDAAESTTQESAATGEECGEQTSCMPDGRRKDTVVVISSDRMGEGDDELGKVLMKGFIYALTEQEQLPQTMLFYNGGAKLTCEESPTLEDLKSLEAQGVEILICGTCLNYYGLTERLQVGSVSNMYAIAEKLTQAGHIIKP